MRKWLIFIVGLCGITMTACGQDGQIQTATQSPAGNQTAKAWTRESVAALFLTPAEAGLTGGEVTTDPAATSTSLRVCVALDPEQAPTVPMDKRYATDRKEIGLPYKGHLVQQGWVLPTEADATEVMKQVGKQIPRCRYSGSARDPFDNKTRITGTSDPRSYPVDSFGWHGHRIEQTMSRDGKRVSVSTQLLLQRGPVVLALDYIDYTTEVPKQNLWDSNMTVLHKILAHSA
jgi:hypothetical protein